MGILDYSIDKKLKANQGDINYMKENIIYTILGFIAFALLFFDFLVFRHALWIGFAIPLTIIGSILLGQIFKWMASGYKKRKKKKSNTRLLDNF